MKESLLHVFIDGMYCRFNAVSDDGKSSFGGPQERRVTGVPHGPHRLHQVAELVGEDVAPEFIALRIPLIYGFRFDGCRLKYKFTTNKIDVVELDPHKSSDEWPYHDYPPLFPYVRLAGATPEPSSWDAFSRAFPNLPSTQPARLIAVVSPPVALGFSMWGKMGDAEGVCVVFECDVEEKSVNSYNICT